MRRKCANAKSSQNQARREGARTWRILRMLANTKIVAVDGKNLAPPHLSLHANMFGQPCCYVEARPLAPDFNVEVLCGSLPPVQDCFHPVDASILKSGGRGEKESRRRSGTRKGVRKIALNRCKIDSINRTGAPHIVYMTLKFRCPKSMNAF